MKQLRLLFLVLSTLLSSVASANQSMKDDNLYNWTGFYVGLNLGAVNHTLDITDNQATTFNATIQQVSNPKVTGGFQMGYRRQLDLTMVSGVYGLEFSTNFSNAQFQEEYGSPFALYQLSSENTLKNLCLLEFLGGLAAHKTLLFLAAGLSWVNITGDTTSVNGIPFFDSFSLNKKQLGTALGAGIEYLITGHSSIRLKVDMSTPNTYTTTDNTGSDFSIANSIVQGVVGFNYKF